MHEGRALAEKIDFPFFETWAKTNSNVVEVFHEFICMITKGNKKDDADMHDSQGAKGCDKKKMMLMCMILKEPMEFSN
jgi:hypothetical protein